MRKLKIAYFGSPLFSADLLESILADKDLPVEISLIVTQPDKPVGKKHIITPSPVKVVAQKHHIPCWDRSIRDNTGFFSTWDVLAEGQRGPTGDKKDGIGADLKTLLNQVDLALVFAYGFKELIPLDLLGAPKMLFDIGEGKQSGFVNIHPSLLPLYRGSSPIAYPILMGDKATGVSLFVMDEKMDHGPLVAQETVQQLNDVRPAMETLLTQTGTKMAKQLLGDLAAGKKIILKPQDHAKATRAPYMVKDDGYISFDVLKKALRNEPLSLQELPQILRHYIEKYWKSLESEGSDIFTTWDARQGGVLTGVKNGRSGTVLYNFWRGMYPWPGVWTKVTVNSQEKRLKLNKMKLENNILSLTEVQLEGKNGVDFPTFQKAYGLL